MKKLTVFVVVVLFMAGMTSAWAAQATQGKTHVPAGKSINDGTFQAAADHVEKWGDSAPNVKASSLRGNDKELARRRGK